jgi:hypothetical protein
MTLLPEPSQQLEFVRRVLPELFHATPEQFLRYLERDGTKFLRFYWEQAGKKLSAGQLSPVFGLNYEIRRPAQREGVALIRLPEPRVSGEAYFAALVYRPARVTPFLRISDTTLVITLEQVLDEQGLVGTLLVETTRRLERLELDPGPEPRLEEFFQVILKRLKKE